MTILLSDEIFALLEQKATGLGVTPAQMAAQILAEQFGSNQPASRDDLEFVSAMTASLRQTDHCCARLSDLNGR